MSFNQNSKSPVTPWPSSLKRDTLAIKTSVVHDQLKVNWTIDEFGTIPKNNEILKLYDTGFVVGEKKDIPCQWRVGLSLGQEPPIGGGNSDLEQLEEWLILTYGILTAPPNASRVLYRLGAQVENPFGGGPFSVSTPNLEPWTNFKDMYGIPMVPCPNRWPADKPLEIDLDLTVVVKRDISTSLVEGIQGQNEDSEENVSSTCVVMSPAVQIVNNPLKRKKMK